MTAFSPFGDSSTPDTSLNVFALSTAAFTAFSHVIPPSFTPSTNVFIAAAVAYFSRSNRSQSAFSSEMPPGTRGASPGAASSSSSPVAVGSASTASAAVRFHVDDPAPSLNIFTGISSVSPSSLYG